MFVTDYHVHSLCSADGTLSMADMAKAAIKNDVQEICFTDHADTLSWGSGKYIARDTFDWAPFTAAYKEALEQVGDRINIKLGVELGEMMGHPERANRYLDDAPELDFVIGSLHLMGDRFDRLDFCNVDRVIDRWDEAISTYLQEQIGHVAWGRFSVIGHLTFPLRYAVEKFKFDVSFDNHMDEVEKLLRAVVEKGVGIECNTNRAHMPLPGYDILKLYRQVGGEIITLGTDAHRDYQIGKAVPACMELLRACGFRYFCTFEKMKPIFHKL